MIRVKTLVKIVTGVPKAIPVIGSSYEIPYFLSFKNDQHIV
jgi:hypothetical protein